MSKLVAVDVAILPPPDITARAIALSDTLAAEGSAELRLDAEHLPHITLTQHFIREEELDDAFARVDDVVAGLQPIRVRATGAGRSDHTLWIAIENTPDLSALHERLMEALRGYERPDGGTSAFFEGEGRVRDVLWVAGYRLKSSFSAFTPHITLGHGDRQPAVEPFAFDATAIAACHLGRFCTCRRVLRAWNLGAGR
jgi:2'-5' RNA ligase